MKSRSLALRISGAIITLSVLSILCVAQDREKYGISAKAGGVNVVSGRVTLTRSGQNPQLLTSQDDLASGDVVNTGTNSQVEVLLNPGSYLRLTENSQFTMVNTSLSELEVKINRGSAIIEATGPENLRQYIPVETEQGRVAIVQRGIYRINALSGMTELLVRKGRVLVRNDPNFVVKDERIITFTGAKPEVAKLAGRQKDAFDEWSRERGQLLARSNVRVSPGLLHSYVSQQSALGWGLWTYSSRAGCYTFLPWYPWSSPYGRAYAYYEYRYGYRGEWADANRPYISNSPGNGTFGAGSPPVGTVGPNGGPRYGPSGNVGSSGSRSISSPSQSGSQAGRSDPDSGNRIVNKVRDPIN